MDRSRAMGLAGRLAFKEEKGLDKRIHAALKRRYFEELSSSWDLWYELYYHNDPPGMTREQYEDITRKEAGRLIEWLPRRAVFLDLGCGEGRILKLAAPRCAQAHGADISRMALAHGRRNCRGRKNVRFHRVKGWELDFPARKFDVVYCHLMLSHLDVEPVVSCVREVARVLKPGGRFLFDLPHLLDEAHLSYLLKPELTNWPGSNRPRFWTAEMVQALLPRCGFRVEEIRPGRFIEVRAVKDR